MAGHDRPKHVEVTWRRAAEAVAELHARRLTPDDDWHAEHRRLWDALVAKSGAAATAEGELIRCTGRLADEAYRNGNCNFGPDHVAMIDFVEETLTQGDVFTAAEIAEIRRDASVIRSNDAYLDLALNDSCYYRLAACAVRWCRRSATHASTGR